MKICTRCKENKPLTKFCKNKNTKDGRLTQCKDCEKIYRKENADKLRAHKKKYKENNADKIKAQKKIYRENNADKIRARNKIYRENNIDKERAQYKIYSQRPEVKDRNNKRLKQRRRTDVNFRLTGNLRCRLRNALNRNQKSASTLALLGCSVEQLKRHLEKQFVEGMSWNNIGTVFHIDHMIPCSLFDLSDAEQQRRCFHFTNLQPLFASENMTKGNKNIYGPYMKWEKGEWYIKINGDYMPRSTQVNRLIPTRYFYPINWMISQCSSLETVL